MLIAEGVAGPEKGGGAGAAASASAAAGEWGNCFEVSKTYIFLLASSCGLHTVCRGLY